MPTTSAKSCAERTVEEGDILVFLVCRAFPDFAEGLVFSCFLGVKAS